ncbi:MAG: UDP-3-O-(3-hydroxymyristoyl)glucosamine N-acyltransferase [Methyloligellaceae bacterium]
MEHPGFFERAGPFTLQDVAESIDAKPADGSDLSQLIEDVKPVHEAGKGHITFVDNRKYFNFLETTSASACILSSAAVKRAPDDLICLITAEPYNRFARAPQLFYPSSKYPLVFGNATLEKDGAHPGNAWIDPSAELEEGVVIEPGALIGPETKIGRNTRICAGAVIGYRVYIGRDCYVGANASLGHCLIGNDVIIHAGVCIGKDGFGYAMGPTGHTKVYQIGRVIVQDKVDIGANTTIDRGALSDTIIGEGTKIDNLVQIGHNVSIGRHCIIVSGAAIAGSTALEDFVALGGKVAVNGHITIGMGAQIAASSSVKDNVPAGGRWGGTPAKPVADWFRELTVLKQLAKKK